MSFACLKYLSVDELKTGEKGRELIGDPYLLKHTRTRFLTLMRRRKALEERERERKKKSHNDIFLVS